MILEHLRRTQPICHRLGLAPELSSRATLLTLLHLFFCTLPLPNLLLFVHHRNWIPTRVYSVESSCHGTYNVGDLRAHASNPILPSKTCLSRSGSALGLSSLPIEPPQGPQSSNVLSFSYSRRPSKYSAPSMAWLAHLGHTIFSAPLRQPPGPNAA